MMNILRFEVPGNPISWKRTKTGVNQKTGRAIRFNPKKMKERQNDVWIACHRAMAEQGFPRAAGAVALFVLVKFRRPKSDAGRPWHTQVPDYDNCGKLVADALKGVAWNDDAQVVGGPTWKCWVDEEPGYVVWVKRLPGMVDRAKDAFRQLRAASSLVLDVFEHETKRGMGF